MRASTVISSLAAFFITVPLLFTAPAFIACKAWREEIGEAGERAEAVAYEAAEMRKNIPAHRVGKLWKFKRSELDAWVASGKSAE